MPREQWDSIEKERSAGLGAPAKRSDVGAMVVRPLSSEMLPLVSNEGLSSTGLEPATSGVTGRRSIQMNTVCVARNWTT
jgi:hypothetical protein